MVGAVTAGWMGWSVAFNGFGDLSDSRRVVIAVMFGAFAILLASAGVSHAVALFDPTPPVVIDERGLLDRRVMARPVPLTDVEALLPVLTGRHYTLVLHTARPQSYGLPHHPLWRVNTLAGRLLRRADLGVKLMGLDIEVMDMIAAIEAQATADAERDVTSGSLPSAGAALSSD